MLLFGPLRLPADFEAVAQAVVTVWQQTTHLAQGMAERSLARQRQVPAEGLVSLKARARLQVFQKRRRPA